MHESTAIYSKPCFHSNSTLSCQRIRQYNTYRIICDVKYGNPVAHSAELEPLDITCTSMEHEDYSECFGIWYLTRDNLGDEKTAIFCLRFIGKHTYISMENPGLFPASPVSYDKVKKLLRHYFKPTSIVDVARVEFSTRGGAENWSARDFVLELQKNRPQNVTGSWTINVEFVELPD